MDDFLFRMASSWNFFIGSVFVLLAILTSFGDKNSIVKFITRILFVLGLALVLLSGTPMSGVYFRIMVTVMFALFVSLYMLDPVKGLFTNFLRLVLFVMICNGISTERNFWELPQLPPEKIAVKNIYTIGDSFCLSNFKDIKSWHKIAMQKNPQLNFVNLSKKKLNLQEAISKGDLLSKDDSVIILNVGMDDIKNDINIYTFKTQLTELFKSLKNGYKNRYILMFEYPATIKEAKYNLIQRIIASEYGVFLIHKRFSYHALKNTESAYKNNILSQFGHNYIAKVVMKTLYLRNKDKLIDISLPPTERPVSL